MDRGTSRGLNRVLFNGRLARDSKKKVDFGVVVCIRDELNTCGA